MAKKKNKEKKIKGELIFYLAVKKEKEKNKPNLPQASEPVTLCWGCLQQQMHLTPMGFPGLPVLLG